MSTPQEHLREQVTEAVAQGWCVEPNTHKVMDVELATAIIDKVVAKVEPMMALLRMYHSQEVELADKVLSHDSKASEACEVAWGIIANVGGWAGGGWESQGEEWQAAATRWRDDYWHPLLGLLAKD